MSSTKAIPINPNSLHSATVPSFYSQSLKHQSSAEFITSARVSPPLSCISLPTPYQKHSPSSSPNSHFKTSPSRPASFLNIDTPRNSPPSPRIRPSSIDTSFSRLSIESKTSRQPSTNSSSRPIPRPQRRLKSILKQTSLSTPTPSTDSTDAILIEPPNSEKISKSKIQFNVAMEQICLFSRDDFPSFIQDSPRTTVNDSGDIEAISASAGWAAIQTPQSAGAWAILSTNHASIVKMAAGDAVQLESARIQGETLIGGVIVRNYSFHKTVNIRYTSDGWKSSTDIYAMFCNSIKNVSNDPYGLDRFTFSISLPELIGENSEETVPIKIVFAIQYSVDSRTYWDNNKGENYVVVVAYNPEASSESADTSKAPWETTAPRPRQRGKNGRRISSLPISDSSLFQPRHVSIALQPAKSLTSNFDGANTFSRIDDSFAAPSFPRASFKLETPKSKVDYNLTSSLDSSPYGVSYSSFGSGSSLLTQNTPSQISQTLIGMEKKIEPTSRLYASEDFYMSSPPSPLGFVSRMRM